MVTLQPRTASNHEQDEIKTRRDKWGKRDSSCHSFSIIVTLQPKPARYLHGLAAVERKRKNLTTNQDE